MSEIQTKTKVQFDFTPEALEKLDSMKALDGAATRAEVVRNALRLYEWFLNEDKEHPNSIVTMYDQNRELFAQFKLNMLLK
jgi:metal-responsive CopG/Arc/MetJ family transcriptional regulator